MVVCHGNAGCRVDANGPALSLLSRGISCFCFDFSGCGLSGGDLVTLGAKEAADLDAARAPSAAPRRAPAPLRSQHSSSCVVVHMHPAQVVKHLRAEGRVANLALWGRSMGAATSLIYAAQNLSIAGLVLDSPFTRLTDLIRDIVSDMTGGRAPGWLARAHACTHTPPCSSALRVHAAAAAPQTGTAIRILRASLRKRCGVDIAAIDAVAAASNAYQPALFIHAEADELISPAHSEALYAAYAGDKRLMLVRDGQTHNSLRPRYAVDGACTFLANVLRGGLKDADALFQVRALERAPRSIACSNAGSIVCSFSFAFSTAARRARRA